MEALQVLVAARALGHTWHGSAVVTKLDCLALVAAMNKGRHQHEPINDIMSELNHLQMKHDFVLTPAWVRRFKNEAVDALSKDDMPRFWHNIQGDRTLINLTPDHLRFPTNAHGPKRARLMPTKITPKYTTGERRDKDQTHDKRPMKTGFAIPSQASERNLHAALEGAIDACKKAAKKRCNLVVHPCCAWPAIRLPISCLLTSSRTPQLVLLPPTLCQ